jgi:phosphotransferase system enzyme I (PtsP)
MASRRLPLKVRIHSRGDARLDGFLELCQEASRPRPLADTLVTLSRRIAALTGAPVCSIYLIEGEAEAEGLVLRANVGFPASALGQVRLRGGEGITGFAVECLRPVSVAFAARDPRNKPFAELGEERFPVFLAVPLCGGGGRALGALVVQRATRRFAPAEVTLVAALAMPVVHAIELARAHAKNEAPGGPVRLRGEPVAPGQVLGRVAFSAGARVERKATEPLHGEAAVAAARVAYEAAVAALAPLAGAHPVLRTVLGDARPLERARELCLAGAGPAAALDCVARESAVLAARAGDPLLRARAVDLEGLCDRAVAHVSARVREAPPRGAVLCVERASSWDVLELAAAGGVGLAVATSAPESPGLALAAGLRLVASAGVGGLFRWARPGARALLDGDTGEIVLEPSRGELARYRLRRAR